MLSLAHCQIRFLLLESNVFFCTSSKQILNYRVLCFLWDIVQIYSQFLKDFTLLKLHFRGATLISLCKDLQIMNFVFRFFFYFSILCISVMYYNTSKEYKGSYSGRLESSQDQFKQINVTLCQHSQVNLSGHAILSISLRCLDIRDTFLTHCCDLSVILSHFSREDTLQTVRCQTGQRSSVSKTSHAIS